MRAKLVQCGYAMRVFGVTNYYVIMPKNAVWSGCKKFSLENKRKKIWTWGDLRVHKILPCKWNNRRIICSIVTHCIFHGFIYFRVVWYTTWHNSSFFRLWNASWEFLGKPIVCLNDVKSTFSVLFLKTIFSPLFAEVSATKLQLRFQKAVYLHSVSLLSTYIFLRPTPNQPKY